MQSRSDSLNHSSVVTPPSAQILTVAPVAITSYASMSYSSSDATTAHLQWQQAIEAFIDEPIEANQIQLTADSPATGARALLLSLFTVLSGTSSDPLPAGALVRNCQLHNLSSRRYQFRMYVLFMMIVLPCFIYGFL